MNAPIRSERGFVAAGHPATCGAAGAMLAAGGNAFDAVVAAGFAAAVAEPQLTGLAGGGFLLARTAAGVASLHDFFVDTPGRGSRQADAAPDFVPVTVHFGHAEQDFNVGLASVAVPGCLAGYLRVHAALGRLSLAEVVAPATALARDGVELNSHHAYLVEILQPILRLSETGRRLYTRAGRSLREGDRLLNADLASYLDRVAVQASLAEPRGFAAPDVAELIAADMLDGGGLLTAEDLAAYRVCERSPLAVDYRGHRLLTNPPPAFGGSLLALSLSLLEDGGAPPPWGSAAHLERLVEMMVETEVIRARGGAEGRPQASRGTTHVSICDREGNVASMTTSNGEGSGYIAAGTGVMFNNMLGEDDLHPDGFHTAPPGERVASMMCPSLLLRDDEVVLVLGSGGSKRIRTALAQVVANVVDYGMSAREAVEAPRLHWDGERVEVEPGFSDAALQALADRWPVNRWSERNLYFGGVHAVAPGRGGVGDPRRGGAVLDC